MRRSVDKIRHIAIRYVNCRLELRFPIVREVVRDSVSRTERVDNKTASALHCVDPLLPLVWGAPPT